MLRQNNLIVSVLPSFTSYPTSSYYLGKRNGLNLQNPMLYAFASLGDTLTDTEASDFYTAVQAFQTTAKLLTRFSQKSA